MVVLQPKSQTKIVDNPIDDLGAIFTETVEESGQQQNYNYIRMYLLIIYSIIKLSYSMGNLLWVPAQQEIFDKHSMLGHLACSVPSLPRRRG